MWVFLNDRFVKRDEAKISVFDHGFLYGDGVYETLRSYNGRFLLSERHVARLRRSCNLIGLDLPIPEDQWSYLLTEALQRNGLVDASIRITISRGEGEMGIDPSLCGPPTVVILARPFVPYPLALRERGVRLDLVNIRRNPLTAQSPQIKSLSFLNNILAKQEAVRAGAFDAIMLNIEGFITECTTSNVFFVEAGELKTPSTECGILDGITREIVMTLGQEQEIQVKEGCYTPDMLLNADECFITNTGMEVMPVREVGNNPIGGGCPGPLTKLLSELFTKNLDRFLSNAIPKSNRSHNHDV